MRVEGDVFLRAVTRKEPLAQGRRGPDMNRNSTRLLLLVAATLFFSSAFPNPAPAQTVSFVAREDYAVGPNPASVAVGDFNRDGRPDLAVANYAASLPGTVSVLLGNGDGTFQPALIFGTSGANPEYVAVGDFNGDGVPDLAVAHSGSTPGTVSVLLGNGDGTFQPARLFAAGQGSLSVAVGDVNGDGRPDLAVANYYSNDVSVLLGNGDGTFQAAQSFTTAGPNPVTVAMGDVNGDGRLDLAVTNSANTSSGALPGNISVLLGNGDGTFQTARTLDVGITPAFVAVRDVNGDGRPDLAVANFNSNNVPVLINTPAPAPTTFPLTVNKPGTGRGPVPSPPSPASPTQINCGATCAVSYDSGTVVTLTAMPNTGSTFTGWSGCDTVSGTTCTVTMSTARSVTATFDLQSFIVTVNKPGTGSRTVTSSPPGIVCGTSSSGCSANYTSGTTVTLTATPTAGSIFTGWSGCDTASGTSCIVTMSAARSVTVIFTPQTFNLTVNKTGLIASGTVTSNPPGINCGATSSPSYDSGTVVTLTPTPAFPSIFTA